MNVYIYIYIYIYIYKNKHAGAHLHVYNVDHDRVQKRQSPDGAILCGEEALSSLTNGLRDLCACEYVYTSGHICMDVYICTTCACLFCMYVCLSTCVRSVILSGDDALRTQSDGTGNQTSLHRHQGRDLARLASKSRHERYYPRKGVKCIHKLVSVTT